MPLLFHAVLECTNLYFTYGIFMLGCQNRCPEAKLQQTSLVLHTDRNALVLHRNSVSKVSTRELKLTAMTRPGPLVLYCPEMHFFFLHLITKYTSKCLLVQRWYLWHRGTAGCPDMFIALYWYITYIKPSPTTQLTLTLNVMWPPVSCFWASGGQEVGGSECPSPYVHFLH